MFCCFVKCTTEFTHPTGVAAVGDGACAPAASAEPHSPQNFVPGGFAAPHVAQATASNVPHSPQNLRFGSFSLPQLEQTVTV
jgi:hypothetical protein